MTASPDKLGKMVAEAMHAAEATASAWDLKLEDAGCGWARCSMVLREDMMNGFGTAHGGMIFALADNAFAYACNSRNVKSFAQTTSISFVSPGKLGERLVAEAREEAAAGRTEIYTVKIAGEDGRTVAIFQGLSRTAGGKVIEDE